MLANAEVAIVGLDETRIEFELRPDRELPNQRVDIAKLELRQHSLDQFVLL